MGIFTAVTARAPAKVNLELAVGAPRPDGYHELATVFHAVSMFDDVTVSPMQPAQGFTISVEGLHAQHVPLDASNLAVRAAELLARRIGRDVGAHLHLRKNIPVAGGMAGGSADAAAALVACDALWGSSLSRDALRDLGAELGSDVPFAMLGGTALGTGRGEQLTPALARGDYHWVVALAAGGLSTPAVFAELDRLRAGRVLPEPHTSDRIMHALRTGDPQALGAALHNDLEPAACSLSPALRQTLDVGLRRRALGGIVSGSGPTVVFLVASIDHGVDVASALIASGVAHDVRRIRGPAPGARIVEPIRA